MQTGIELITEERWEQVYKHSWGMEHDADHDYAELAINAAALAVLGTDYKIVDQDGELFEDDWGLCNKHSERKPPYDRIHALQVAGALIAAEIDRLQHEVKLPTGGL